MIRRPRNIEINDEKCVYGMRKTTYWRKYGLKRFPYPGTRRYKPLIYQSLDGGMIISNDVFGLTISQFERKFRACLKRRTTQEQWILNLRYPDKSSNEYIEYLQTCTDQSNDNYCWSGNNLEDKKLYEHLLNTAGTEIDIRTRQRLCIIQNTIHNATSPNSTKISSRSLAEGLDLPGSDRDDMYVFKNDIDVIQNTNVKQHCQQTTLVMETDFNHPGFTKLKLVAGEVNESLIVQGASFRDTSKCFYFSVKVFVDVIQHLLLDTNINLPAHGPCLSDKGQTLDIAFCLRSKYFLYTSIPWVWRHRKQWPPNIVIDRIISFGCLLVPIGPKTISENHLLWRLSFSVAEKLIVYSFNFTQLLCYSLLKH